MYAAAMDCTIAAAFSIICCPCQLPSCVAVAVAVCPRPATAAGVPGRFSALGAALLRRAAGAPAPSAPTRPTPGYAG